MALIFDVQSGGVDNALPVFAVDPVLADAAVAGATLALYDASFRSYGGASPVVNLASLAEVRPEVTNPATVKVPGSGLIFAGGGFDFAGATLQNTQVELPASVAAGIVAASQNFMVMLYMKLPAVADFPSAQTNDNLNQIFTFAATNPNVAADFLSISMRGLGGPVTPRLRARRQTAIGTLVTTDLGPLDNTILGQVCQILYWRDAAGIGFSMRSAAAGRITATGVRGADNAASGLGSLVGKAGVLNWASDITTGIYANARKLRLYRMLVTGGGTFDAISVAEADWKRTDARTAYQFS